MKKTLMMMLAVLAIAAACNAQECASATAGNTGKAKVYMITNITSENLIKIYKALGREAKGKVGVKISSGEPGGHNFLDANLIKDFVQMVHGTIIEDNTAYPGKRVDTDSHKQVMIDHGFAAIAPTDILDADGSEKWPTMGGTHLQGYDYVGTHLKNYDFMVVLSHFKGHAMGGFGGALKNLSIGCASQMGKVWIHSAGKNLDMNTLWQNLPPQNDFLESMAESASAIIKHYGDKIIYISVMNNLSVDCDCDSHPDDPKMGNVGILASLDPVALDQACVDQVFISTDKGNRDLVERIVSRHGTHTIYDAQLLGAGSRDYELVLLH
ncbi:MAG: DUF362 domain-containing protein [Muribaculaceae bacterium]|jgi:uncharacterized protein|nr:DUF362 domain-containing protein [Muribaculaceae bacterium]